jgi:hypothetical protein
MACSINITSVIGILAAPGSTTTSTIHVTGTLTGECKPTAGGAIEIIVEGTCQSNSAKAIATPDSLGNWSADIPLRCTCGGDIIVTASCATDPTCTETRGLNLQCEENCPTGSIGVSVGDCNSDGTRNVTLTANITSFPFPPGTMAVGQFDYGDGTVSNGVVVTQAGVVQDPGPPGPPHPYTPPGPPNPVRFFWALLPANCPPLTTVVSGLESCNGGGGDGGGGEGGGCRGLRWAGVIAAILAALALYICQCVPIAGVAFCWASLGFAIVAAVLLGIWLFLCPKPCGAALLIGWQIALGAGIGALYFANCCPTLWAIGAALIAAALAGLIAWIVRCEPTRCQVLAELGVVITVVILPILGWVAGISFLQPCLNPIVAASVSTLSGLVSLGLIVCASKAPEPEPPTM